MEDQDTFLQLPEKRKISIYRDFHHDFTSALLVSQNKKKNSWWSKPVLMGVELFSYANISFVATNVHSYWPGE